MSTKLYILSKSWSRHGVFSGYEKLIKYFSISILQAKTAVLPYRIANYFVKKTNLINYKSETVFKELYFLLNIFNRKNIHVLYGDMDYYFLYFIKKFPFNIRNNKLVATFHHPPNELEKRLNYNRVKVLGALDKIIVMGPNQIPFFRKYTNAEIMFIPHGINLNYFNYNSNLERLNQIFLIGVSHRDHNRNKKIINKVNKHININFIVIITKEYAHLYDGLKNVTIVTDNISDEVLLNYYQQSKGLLLSLQDCTASNSILEALACGCPLITNNVGAVKDYIPDTSGIPVFETKSIDASVNYIVKLLKDDVFLNKISFKQRALALKYDWKTIAKTTEDFILA